MASYLNIAPTAVILAAAASCAWPYFGESEAAPTPVAAVPNGKGKEKAGSEVALSLLNPLLAPRPARDPFEDREALRVEAHEKISKLLKHVIDTRQRAMIEAKRQRPGAGRSIAKGKAGGKAGEAANPLDGMVLTGTSVGGNRGAAVINGKAYATGDAIETQGAAGRCVLGEVHKGHVVLHHNGRKLSLSYASPTASLADAKRPGGSPAKPGGAAKGGKKKGFDPFDD